MYLFRCILRDSRDRLIDINYMAQVFRWEESSKLVTLGVTYLVPTTTRAVPTTESQTQTTPALKSKLLGVFMSCWYLIFIFSECSNLTELTQLGATILSRVLVQGKSQTPIVVPSPLVVNKLPFQIDIDFSRSVCLFFLRSFSTTRLIVSRLTLNLFVSWMVTRRNCTRSVCLLTSWKNTFIVHLTKRMKFRFRQRFNTYLVLLCK